MYRITVDREACAGVFACLVHDDRFVEAEDGFVTLQFGDGDPPTDNGETVTAVVEDDRREAAERAAAACPVDAITVEER